MLRKQRQLVERVQRILDAGLFCLGFWLAHLLRESGVTDSLLSRPGIQPFESYAWFLVPIFILTPLLLQSQGFYGRPVLASRRRRIWRVALGSIYVSAALVILSFLTREEPARGVLILFAPISFCLVATKEELVRRWRLSSLGQAQLRKRVLLVGVIEDTTAFEQRLKAISSESVEIVDTIDLGELSNARLRELLHRHSVNGVLLTAKHTSFGRVEEIIASCELEGVEVWLVADFFKTQISQTTMDDFQGHPMLVFRSTPEVSWQSIAKQVIDVSGALLILLASLPLTLAVAVLIRVSSPGPIFFRQQRCGLNGRPFTMLKFRSMVSDAEQRKHELEVLNEMSGPVFKVSNDPRITPVGRFLRKFSVDEFPQLLNVLRGEMSLVGPRPLPVDEVARFDDISHRRRLSVRPGITCLWQISGRNNVTDFQDWVRLDLEYIDNWSLWLDLKILVRTVPVVLLGFGAK